MRILADNGIQTGVTMIPGAILALRLFHIHDIGVLKLLLYCGVTLVSVEKAAEAGATYILPWMGMTMRDQQREYYYTELDQHYPGTRQKYQCAYGDSYGCDSPHATHLYDVVNQFCTQQDIVTKLLLYTPQKEEQLNLFTKS